MTGGADPGVVELRISRGSSTQQPRIEAYAVPEVEGMVVLDAVHHVQRFLASDLACRWNCKAARCGSCSAEVNGRPVLLCKTRVDALPPGPIHIAPMKAFPLIKDLVTDVSQSYAAGGKVRPFRPAVDDRTEWRIEPGDIERLHEFRRCIECFLCQDVCHVLREHDMADRFLGPRNFVRVAGLEMHPRDTLDRIEETRVDGGLDYCNVTRCCTDVCPEGIRITDNAIIPLKERSVDQRWDPFRRLGRRLRGLRGAS